MTFRVGAGISENSPHVGRRLDGRNVLEDNVSHPDDADECARNDAEPLVSHCHGADEDVEDAATEEGEHKGGISGDLLWDLELCSPSQPQRTFKATVCASPATASQKASLPPRQTLQVYPVRTSGIASLGVTGGVRTGRVGKE